MTEGPQPTIKQRISRANVAYEQEDFASALSELREILRVHPDFPDLRNRSGFCRAMLGDAEGALEDFEHAVRINPEYAEAHLNRALLLNELGRFDEAEEAFARAQELDHRPGEPFPVELGNRLAVEHAKLGDLYLQADDATSAVREYRKGLELRPYFVDIRSRLAQAYLVQGKVEEAIQELQEVLAEHPSFNAARIRLGVALQRAGRIEEAAAEWRNCLEMEPEDRRARAYLESVGIRVEEVAT